MTSNHRKQRVKKTYKKDMQKRDLLKQVLKLGVMPIVLLMFFSCADDNTFNNQDPEAPQIGGTPFDIFTDMDYTQMIYINGGTFEMGATEEQISDAQENESPAHKVTLDGYYISKYEVTQKLWERVMGNNPSSIQGEDLPVNNISWDDCQEFIKKLNELTGKQFALPTEAEWEYAARGGDKSLNYKFSGGSTIDDVAYYNTSSSSKVGEKQANELGLYDMSGNVAEWCYDGYATYSDQEQTNPFGVIEADIRVVRGGSWKSSDNECRVSFRGNDKNSSDKSEEIGFRLVLSKPYYEVSVVAEVGGSAEINNCNKTLFVREGAKVNLKASDGSYSFVNWLLNNKNISDEKEFSPVITSDAKYVANFGYCKITLKNSPEGSLVQITQPSEKPSVVAKDTEITIDCRVKSGYKFVYWLANGKFLSTTKKLTSKITESTEYTPFCAKIEKENNYEYVDMGLSVMWASYNIGAKKQEEAGNFYAWGETTTKTEYNISTYSWWDETIGMTKYCTDSSFGNVDNKNVLDSEDDIATYFWKGNWRIPTTKEWEELRNECEWTWMEDMNGVKGYFIMSKNKDNYIFLPAAGYLYNAPVLEDSEENVSNRYFANEGGYYWASELSLNNSSDAGYMHFYKDTHLMGYHERYTGQPIRAVFKNKE